MHLESLHRHRSPTRGSAFTLVELVLVMALLIMVLSVSYGIIIDCLEADRTVEKLTKPEKVGEGILSLIRTDLFGTIWRKMGTRVFFVDDAGGDGLGARDEIRFISTVEPTPTEEASAGSVSVAQLRTITGIQYFLRDNPDSFDGVQMSTLFRKEIVEFYADGPLESPGVAYEIYDKMAYLSVGCYNAAEAMWVQTWGLRGGDPARAAGARGARAAAGSGHRSGLGPGDQCPARGRPGCARRDDSPAGRRSQRRRDPHRLLHRRGRASGARRGG